MNIKKLEGHENYTCSVIKLPPMETVPGLDNLVKVTVFGNDCLIGKNSDPSVPYLFFPAECQIDESFLKANNLYRDSIRNADANHKGFFENSGRVKAIKFRGIISTGFVIPLTTLHVLNNLTIGDEFNQIGDLVLCKKYRPVRMQSLNNESRFNKKLKRLDRLVQNQFRFHQSTSHLAKNLHLFSPNDIVVITDKWHGTSAVYANVLVKKQLSWKEKVAKFFGVNVVDKEYDTLYASRTVIKNQYINPGATSGWYNEDIWAEVKEELKDKIEPGITIYGEIVGFLKSGRAIQKGYDYGCPPPDVIVDANGVDIKSRHKFVVYRITYTKPDGNYIEYSWQQIKDYCKKYQLETVKELFFGKAATLANVPFAEVWLEHLQRLYLEKDCKYCVNKVPAEGICVRIDGRENYMTYKLKSKRFLERETKELDSGEVNIEEEQSNGQEATV